MRHFKRTTRLFIDERRHYIYKFIKDVIKHSENQKGLLKINICQPKRKKKGLDNKINFPKSRTRDKEKISRDLVQEIQYLTNEILVKMRT